MDNITTIIISVFITVLGIAIYELASSHYSKWKERR